MTRTLLDLFAGLGGFSAAFAEADGWEVVTVDVDERFGPDIQADVLDLRPADLPEADLVLASPPCTVFSTAGNHDLWDFDTHEPLNEPAHEHVTLAYHTVGLIRGLAPEYWFLENPRGRLRWFFGEPAGEITYCQYGCEYMKRTDLWGEHPPMTYRHCSRNSKCHSGNVEYDGTSATRVLGDTPAERAKVPRELSEAILEAVKEAYANPPPEQMTLGGASG
jgi:site-specific DNA-cytosine methylase